MIALDTNILVRFLVRDDEVQAAAVYKRLHKAEAAGERLFIPLLVVLETIRVLESAYEVSRREILEALQATRHMAVLRFEADGAIDGFLRDARNHKADLADILIARAAHACGCEAGLTFDKGAAKLPFFELLK